MRLAAAPALLLATFAGAALADAAPPFDYWIDAHDDGSVTIYLSGDRACAEGPLLRRNAGTGEVVALTSCQGERTFLDECVPAGQYQYGLATPYGCSQWGSYYYADASVDAPPAGCTPTVEAPVTAAPGDVPWSSERLICESTYRGAGRGTGCGTGGAVLGTNLLALAIGLALWRRRADRRGA
jgi:hypothetical protein